MEARVASDPRVTDEMAKLLSDAEAIVAAYARGHQKFPGPDGFMQDPMGAHRWIERFNAATALSASPPAQVGVVVRVAVAMEFTAYENEIDRAYAVGWVHGSDEDMMRAACEGMMSDVVVPVGFADIRFTPPAKQEIAVGAVSLPASVSAAGEGS